MKGEWEGGRGGRKSKGEREKTEGNKQKRDPGLFEDG